MESVKRKIVFYWLTHFYLRRIGKRYPEHFKQLIYDLTDNANERKVILLRYTGDTQLKFEAISYEMNTDIRNVFKYHKNVINKIISSN